MAKLLRLKRLPQAALSAKPLLITWGNYLAAKLVEITIYTMVIRV